jgi:thioredoxin reductase (NADPH)
VIETADGQEVTARAVVLASGVTWRRLGIDRLERLIGAGVFYGAAASEARAMQGTRVAIVGGGNAAGQAAVHLAKYADQVTVLVRGDRLAKSMSDYLITELGQLQNVTVRLSVDLVDGEGDEHLEGVVIRDRATGAVERLAVAGLFVMIGAVPHTEWLEETVERDEWGYVLTGADIGGEPVRVPFETSVPGIYAAGDVRHGSVKRVTTAMGEGAAVVQLVHRHVT